jgi:transposase
MPARRKETVDIREILRLIQCGKSDRLIGRATGIDRRTVARYRRWAEDQELLTGPLPSPGELHRLLEETLPESAPPQNISTVAPYKEEVIKLRKKKVEIAAIHQRLTEQGYTGSYSAVHRFVRKLEPVEPDPTTRVETAPAEQAQVDFGSAGQMIDPKSGKLRKAWAFVMTLSWSRHQYVEFVFDQKVATWLRLHRNAFAFFDGVPGQIVPDNLKAAIVKACWNEPEAQQAYRECAEHYNFLIAPCGPGLPQHKGKVEQGGVHYVKRNFLAGRDPMTITQANEAVLRWVNTTAGQRIHGTVKERPLVRFETEQPMLFPLPTSPYDLAVWKQAKVSRDCYVVFEKAYYSIPFRLVGEHVRVRGGTREVQIYTQDFQLVATHTRAETAGDRQTNLDHLPPAKVPGLVLKRESCRQRAIEIGPATSEVVGRLLDHRPEDRLRTAGRLLRLAERFSCERLEAACARALFYDDPAYSTIKRILEEDQDREPLDPPARIPATALFMRSAAELVGHLVGGGSWK